MKLISWNVNGLRACNKEGKFLEYVEKSNADFICIQETKISEKGQINFNLEKYHDYWNCSKVKKGYSGTAIFAKEEPLCINCGIHESDYEGRIITLEYDKFYLVNCYAPNTQMNTSRLNFRLDWNDMFNEYIEGLNYQKNVILCGDINVAHKDIDVCEKYRGKTHAGFSPEEKSGFQELLDIGLIDTFRHLNPSTEKFSWWFRNRLPEEFVGWRLDYFLVSEELKEKIIRSDVCTHIEGSDHCPIELEVEL